MTFYFKIKLLNSNFFLGQLDYKKAHIMFTYAYRILGHLVDTLINPTLHTLCTPSNNDSNYTLISFNYIKP